MQKLTLDYSTWRCGGNKNSENILGEGPTQLLNGKGYMCCLGQFSLQLDEELEPKDIITKGDPADIQKNIFGLVDMREDDWQEDDYIYLNSALSSNAIEINDNEETTPEQKIEKLKELFSSYDFEIDVINKP